jgi:hypothetical protein
LRTKYRAKSVARHQKPGLPSGVYPILELHGEWSGAVSSILNPRYLPLLNLFSEVWFRIILIQMHVKKKNRMLAVFGEEGTLKEVY